MVRTRIRSHSTGVRSSVSILCALVILDGNRVNDVSAVEERLKGKFLAVELFLYDDLLSCAEYLSAVSNRLSGGMQVLSEDFHSLAAGQPIGFDDKCTKRLKVLSEAFQVSEDTVLGISRNAVFREQLPCE